MKLLIATTITVGLITHRPAPIIETKPYTKIVMLMPTKKQLQAYATQDMNPHQAACLRQLWMKESGWRYWADSPTSSAYGVAQVLRTPQHLTPWQQIDRGIRYITHRYHTPCKAWGHWLKRGWY